MRKNLIVIILAFSIIAGSFSFCFLQTRANAIDYDGYLFSTEDYPTWYSLPWGEDTFVAQWKNYGLSDTYNADVWCMAVMYAYHPDILGFSVIQECCYRYTGLYSIEYSIVFYSYFPVTIIIYNRDTDEVLSERTSTALNRITKYQFGTGYVYYELGSYGTAPQNFFINSNIGSFSSSFASYSDTSYNQPFSFDYLPYYNGSGGGGGGAVTVPSSVGSTAAEYDDSALRAAISREATTRSVADASLAADIRAEISQRSREDASIRASAAAEAEIRSRADASLAQQIRDETAVRSRADASLSADLQDEIAERSRNVNELRSSVIAEASERSQNDVSIVNDVNALRNDVSSAATQIQEGLTNIQGDISSNHDAVMNAGETDETLNTDIGWLQSLINTLDGWTNNISTFGSELSMAMNDVITELSAGSEIINAVLDASPYGLILVFVFSLMFVVMRKIIGR